MAKRGRPRKLHPIMKDSRARLVWLGNEAGDLETVWNKVTFLAGVPTEVADPMMIGKAKGNPYYEVMEDGRS